MNNLMDINKIDINNNAEISINTKTGEAYISQRKAAELLGVARPSLQSYVGRNLHPVDSELDQGLSSEIFAFCIQYYALDARNPTEQAKMLLKQIAAAGAKAYLYHMAGYNINSTISDISRKETKQLNYLDNATVVIKRELELHSLFGTPLHLAQIESVKATKDITGTDLSRFLLNAPAQQNIEKKDIMLEPSELANKLSFRSAVAFNRWLETKGLQARISGEWIPTDKAEGRYSRHAWKNGTKSGYNYKWNLELLESLM